MSFLNTIFGGDSSDKDTPQNTLDWNELTNLDQLDEIVSESSRIPVIIFKHSTRCGISKMALKGFEREYSIPASEVKAYFLDLLNYREISSAVASRFAVYHESPQLLLIKDGQAVYHESHGGISAEALQSRLNG